MIEDIRMIVTDMDGTFLNSKHEKSPEFSHIYQQLKEKNIIFIPASGRSLPSITNYFEDIENEIGFIADNGCHIIFKNEELYIDQLDYELMVRIIEQSRKINDAHIVLSGKKTAYFETNDEKAIDYISQFYSQYQKVDNLIEVASETIFKIAIYHPHGSEANLYPFMKNFEEFGLKVVVSGEFWLDILNKNTNKGNAVKKLQNLLNISPEQTMAFGDYMNDLEMLSNAKYSFAMENAHPIIKETAQFQTSSNDDFGVVSTIKKYLRQS